MRPILFGSKFSSFLLGIAVGVCLTSVPHAFAAEKAASDAAVASASAQDVADSDKPSVSELSVAPLDHVSYPPDRPAWLSQSPALEATDHTWPVVTPPCDTADEADELLAVLSRAAVDSYIERLTGGDSERVQLPIDDQWIADHLVTQRYQGDLTQGDMPRVEKAVLLTFTPEVQQQIAMGWKNGEVRQRLGAMGVIAGGLLASLILGSGLLGAIGRRLDRSSAQQQPVT